MGNLVDNQIILQIGIIVKDIEEISTNFSNIFGIKKPEWFWTDSFETARTIYRKKPTRAIAKIMFFKFGQIELELIEPDKNPSIWREYLDEFGEGVHHIAFRVKDLEKKVIDFTELGMLLIQKGNFEGGKYAYIDTMKQLKVQIELLELEF